MTTSAPLPYFLLNTGYSKSSPFTVTIANHPVLFHESSELNGQARPHFLTQDPEVHCAPRGLIKAYTVDGTSTVNLMASGSLTTGNA